ncbi:hypothetical protein KC343_g3313 [Hortaea werneckii]|nr:hypothetical protein KC352_g9120 [Hortaea werneckii]KAI7568953.1 hypothetical protein KC317_g3739 [Hortaea werneckii]KAI7622275.1 hypothetical protein KC346_g3283 [Hortaea werneckii]KAI7632768.1 hypothetical protein KC343_g3313 [Hortaea werneckii]KAI7678711.1 hypothetical protein KC319_g3176 [Hortaea werneckii]
MEGSTSLTSSHRSESLYDDDACIRTIFSNGLQKEHEKKADESILQKGFSRIEPVLRGLNLTLDVLEPTSSIEPCASSALAIVRMVATVATAVCGAVTEAQSQIEIFVKALPRIDLCDAIQSGNLKQDNVENALIEVYGDLLNFYFHCREVLESRYFTAAEVKSQIKGDIDSIVKSFSSNLDNLDKAINAGTHDLLHRLSTMEIHREVQELLKEADTKEISYVDGGMRRPVTGACDWVKSNEVFQNWLEATPGTRHVMMCGDMGFGKTYTMAFVRKYLTSAEFAPMKPLVCSYFCKEHGEMNQAKSIYRSLLRQLLAAKVSCRWATHQWHEKTKTETQIDPTQCTDKLRNHLISLVKSLRQALYIVIDALDECSDEARAELKTFFEAICPNPHKPDGESPAHQSRSGLVRLLTSSRYTERARNWNAFETIPMRPGRDRDLLLVQELANRDLCHRDLNMDQAAVNAVVEQVAQEMQGSALWASTVIQWLKTSGVTTEALVREMLQDIPPPNELVRLYGKLFERMVADNGTNRMLLGLCLDLLAGARRLLTLGELSYAAWTGRKGSGEKVKSLVEMKNRAEDWKRILQLVRPFISVKRTSGDEIGPNTSFTLSHQSLRQTIMSIPPGDWITVAPGTMTQDAKPVREAELNSLLLRHCMDYLLLEEFGKQELVNVYNIFAQSFYWSFNSSPAPQERDESTVAGASSVSDDFDPYANGFGGFYIYAACHWTAHYTAVTREHTTDLKDVVALLQPGSLQRRNWVSRRCQPDCKHDFDLRLEGDTADNPVVFVASWGTTDALKELLDRDFCTLGFENEDLYMAEIMETARRSISGGDFQVVEVLLDHPSTASKLDGYEILVSLAWIWRSMSPTQVHLWRRLLERVVERSQNMLVLFAKDVLLQSAKSGCLPMAKKLFDAGECNQRIADCLLQPTTDEWGPIGVAGMFGHTDVVEFLCQQSGIETHLHHRNPEGDNIYHIVARNGNADVLRVLIRYFPEGVNDANGSTTPLQIAVGHAKSVEAARVLLLEGRADLNAGPQYYMPLRDAVRQGRTEMCRMLIVEGKANPWIVVGVTEHPEQSDLMLPILLETIQSPPSSNSQDEQQILKGICALMPLAVSMEFLVY